jgi:hypothetical protein
MGKAYLAKLKCGSREIDLSSNSGLFPMMEGVEDNGQAVVLTLYVKDPSCQQGEVMTFLHNLMWFNARAIEYEGEHVKEPVYLGLKIWDGNTYDTTFGRGWQWKMLTGQHELNAPAVSVELAKDWSDTLGRAMITEVKITFQAKGRKGANGVEVFPWEPLTDRWVGQARGCLRHLSDGALMVEEGTTNKIPNSDFENEADTASGWAVSNADLVFSVQASNDVNLVYNGYWSYLLTAGATARQFYVSLAAGNTNSHTLSCYARRLDGGTLTVADCQLYYGANQTTTFTAQSDRPGWYRLTATFAGIAAATNTGIEVKASKQVIVDSFQMEEKAYVTSLCYGNMGRGYTFSGAAHTTTSVRAPAGIYYRNAQGTCPQMFPRTGGTLLFVAKAYRISTAYTQAVYLMCDDALTAMWLRYNINGTWTFYDGTTQITTGATAFAAGDVLFAFVRYGVVGGTANYMQLDVYSAAGVRLGTASGAWARQEPGTAVWIGSFATADLHWGEIRDVQAWNEALTDAQVQARVAYGEGPSELPYIWSAQGNGTIYNHDDTDASHDNWVELANGPGDYDAGLKILVKNLTASTPQMIYMGQMRRGVPRSDLPSKRYLVGNHFRPWLEAEAGLATYDADTLANPDVLASGGTGAQTTPTTTTEIVRISIPITTEPEDMWKTAGVFRIIPRLLTATASRYQVRFVVVTGYHAGPFSVPYLADGDNVWRPGDPSKAVLAIPSHYQEPDDLQAVRPGEWSGATYCYLAYLIEAAVAAGTIDIDGVWLVPQDQEGYGIMPTVYDWVQNQFVLVDSCSREPKACTVYGMDNEQFRSSMDWSGRLFMPVREPCILTMMWRRSGTGYVWVIEDYVSVDCKYRPRYQKVR